MLLALLVVCAVAVFGWHVVNQAGFTPGSRAGYDLGLSGPLLILLDSRFHIGSMSDTG